MSLPLMAANFAASAYTAFSSVSSFVSTKVSDLLSFLGLAPNPSTTQYQQPSSYVPPFTGGQCSGVNYRVQGVDIVTGVSNPNSFDVVVPGKVSAPASITTSGGFVSYGFYYQNGTQFYSRGGLNWYGIGKHVTGVTITSVTRQDGGIDTCGDLPDPNPSPSPNFPKNQGGFDSQAPYSNGSQLSEAYGGALIPSIGNLGSLLAAAAGLIKTAADALDGIKKVGDAIGYIQKILDEIQKALKRSDKANPFFKKKLIGAWREFTQDDGYINFNKVPIGSKEAIPYGIQVVIEAFDPSTSRILGVQSPDFALESSPVGYLSFQNNSFGIRESNKILFLNSFFYLDISDRGAFLHLRNTPSAKCKFRIFYELESDEYQVQ